MRTIESQPPPAQPGRTGSYVPVRGAGARLPTVQQWQSQVSPFKAQQPAFEALGALLQSYHGHKGGDLRNLEARLAILGQLFFAADQWLRQAAQAGTEAGWLPEAPVLSLYVSVVDTLCQALECSPNVLPEALEASRRGSLRVAR